METRHFALTGATGFLGGHILRRLKQSGHTVSVLVRDRDRLPEAGEEAHPDRIIVGDIRDADAVRSVADGAHTFIHLVSNFRTAADPPEATHATNVVGTINALDAASAADVRRFVHCSTIGVHGHVRSTPATEEAPFNPGDEYQRTKLEAEEAVRARIGGGRMEIVVVRPCSLYGPGDLRMLKMFRMLASRTFMMVGRCDANFHAVYIDDAVEGFRLAAELPEAADNVFIIGGSSYLPLRAYIREAAQAVGAPMPWLRLPYAPMYAAGALCEWLCVPFGIEPPLHRRRVRFFRNNRAFSIQKARRILGYNPAVDLRDGMARTVAWYRSEGLL